MRLMRPTLLTLICLLAMALAVRAFVPVGYMPNLAALASGSIEMVVCTQDGPVAMQMAGDFDPATPSPHQAPAGDEHAMPCAFAALLPWTAVQSDILFIPPIFKSGTLIGFALLAMPFVFRRPHVLRQPRAPPVLSP